MAFKGQPVPSTVYQHGYFKVSDGKSVRVSVPANSGAITAGQLCYFDGFLGFAMQSLANDAVNAQDLILQIEVAEYETDQILATDTMGRGTRIYWDAVNKRLTETPTPVFAGLVTAAKDANNVIWFILTPSILSDEAATVAAALTKHLKNSVQTGVLVGAPTIASTHADAGAFDFNVDITAGIVVVNGVLAEIAAVTDFDVAHGDESPVGDTDTAIVYTIVAAEANGTVTLEVVPGAAAAEPGAANDGAITAAVGHANWIRLATTTVTRTGAATMEQTYSNAVRPKL